MLQKLQISGIRSFSPKSEVCIEFDEKLTLILGKNGAGKSTILECLKLATTGSFPPNSDNGKCFIHDPKLIGAKEVFASIKLTFISCNTGPVKVSRFYHYSRKSDKIEFKKTENILTTLDSSGNEVQKSLRVGEIDSIVPGMIHLNAAILQYVSFCHQDDSLWPFGESSVLKRIFDQIFCTEDFSKAQETLRKFIKEKQKELTKKKEELSWALRQINDDRIARDNLNLRVKELRQCQSEELELKAEVVMAEARVTELKEKALIYEQKCGKDKEIERYMQFLVSFRACGNDADCNYDENTEALLKARVIDVRERLKSLEKRREELDKENERIQKEVTAVIVKAEYCSENLKKAEEAIASSEHAITGDFGSEIKRLTDEYKDLKMQFREKKTENETKQREIDYMRYKAIEEKKTIEEELKILEQKDAKVMEDQILKLEAEIKCVQQTLGSCSEYIKSTMININEVNDSLEKVGLQVAEIRENQEFNKNQEERCGKLLELQSMLMKVLAANPQLEILPIIEYEPSVKSAIAELDKKFIRITSEKSQQQQKLSLAESSILIYNQEITGLSLALNEKNSELMLLATNSQLIFSDIQSLEDKLERELKLSQSFPNNSTSYHLVYKSLVEKSRKKGKCNLCKEAIRDETLLKLESKLSSRTTALEKSESKQNTIKQILDIFKDLKTLKIHLEKAEEKIKTLNKSIHETTNNIELIEQDITEINKQRSVGFEIISILPEIFKLCILLDINFTSSYSEIIKTKFDLIQINESPLSIYASLKLELDQQAFLLTTYEQTQSASETSLKFLTADLSNIKNERSLYYINHSKCEQRLQSLSSITSSNSDSSDPILLSLLHQKRSKKLALSSLSSLSAHTLAISSLSADLSSLKSQQLSLENTLSTLPSTSSLDLEITKLKNELNDLALELESLAKSKAYLEQARLSQEYSSKVSILEAESKRLSEGISGFHLEDLENEMRKLVELRIELGKKEQVIELTAKEIISLEKNKPKSEEMAVGLYVETEVLQKALEEQSYLLKVLENSIITFHKEKIFQINSIISRLWLETYKGTDIESIFITADTENLDRKSSFNYRICFKSRNNDIDMRGRCSSGQRMMASLVIRIALAQAFSTGPTVIALDEPTANMDSFNSEGLAECISTLSSAHKNLQLIIITHDQDFLRKIIRESPRESYLTIEKHKTTSYISRIQVQ